MSKPAAGVAVHASASDWLMFSPLKLVSLASVLGYVARLLSAVWPEIRAAEDYEDINWPAHGLARAPGSRDVQRVMSGNWDELRLAQRFEQIDSNRDSFISLDEFSRAANS